MIPDDSPSDEEPAAKAGNGSDMRERSGKPAKRARLGADLKIKPIRTERDTLQEQIYRRLREVIMTGAIRPGEKLSYRGLADKLGTSPMPVRDAVRRLVSEHVLQVHANRTIGVPLPTRERLAEIYRIREVLEGLAAQEAALRVNKADIKALRIVEDELEAAHHAKDGPADDYLSLNERFHFSIYRMAQMPHLIEMIERLWLQTGPLLNFTRSSLAGHVIFNHHRAAVDALERGDQIRARQEIEGDIRDAFQILVAQLFPPADEAEATLRKRPAG